MSQSAASLSLELKGVRFGHLTAVKFHGVRRIGKAVKYWEFLCTCGNSRSFPLAKVRRGEITNCGCRETEEIDREFSLVDLDEYRKQHGKFRLLPLAVRLDLIRTEFQNRGTFNHAVTPFDLWISDEDTPFQRRHVRVIERAKELWRSVDRPTNETHAIWDGRDGSIPEQAKNLLRNARRLVPLSDWFVFENVVRWNEPYGVPGSRLMSPSPTKEAAALTVVLSVAEVISRALVL